VAFSTSKLKESVQRSNIPEANSNNRNSELLYSLCTYLQCSLWIPWLWKWAHSSCQRLVLGYRPTDVCIRLAHGTDAATTLKNDWTEWGQNKLPRSHVWQCWADAHTTSVLPYKLSLISVVALWARLGSVYTSQELEIRELRRKKPSPISSPHLSNKTIFRQVRGHPARLPEIQTKPIGCYGQIKARLDASAMWRGTRPSHPIPSHPHAGFP
jgi:hypothetical protein